jgi:putative transposase
MSRPAFDQNPPPAVQPHPLRPLYQARLLPKEFSQPFNVVILVKTHLRPRARAWAILFSSDLALAWEKLIDDYRLRFPIEFNFRDAKQSWGLEDFMNTSETAVTNAAPLSLFMVNVGYRLRRDLRPSDAEFSGLDLKAHDRGDTSVSETIKMLPPIFEREIRQKPDENLVAEIFRRAIIWRRYYNSGCRSLVIPCLASARCPAIAHARASPARSKATMKESPISFTSKPPC